MTDKTIIDLKDVSMRRGTKQVLTGVNWKTEPGEHWFILGNNGSGKTTLLEILMGYLWPQKGAVSIMGQRYGKTCLPELRCKIGYVSTWIFQRMQPRYTVRGVVASGVEASVCHWGDEDQELKRKVRGILEKFSCLDLSEKRFGDLSSGEAFKVVLCRALINQPALLILDEPFAYLDIGARQKAYRLLERISRAGSAPQIILVTHHLEDILPIYSHGAIMHQGRMIKRGKKAAILRPEIFQQIFDLEEPSFKM